MSILEDFSYCKMCRRNNVELVIADHCQECADSIGLSLEIGDLVWYECNSCGGKYACSDLASVFRDELERSYSKYIDVRNYIALYPFDEEKDEESDYEEYEKVCKEYEYLDRKFHPLEPESDVDYSFIQEIHQKWNWTFNHEFVCRYCQQTDFLSVYFDVPDQSGHYAYRGFYCAAIKLNGTKFALTTGKQIKKVIKFLMHYANLNRELFYFCSPYIQEVDWLELILLHQQHKFVHHTPNLRIITRAEIGFTYKDRTTPNKLLLKIGDKLTQSAYVRTQGSNALRSEKRLKKRSLFDYQANYAQLSSDQREIYDAVNEITARVTRSDYEHFRSEIFTKIHFPQVKFHAKFYMTDNYVINTSYNYLRLEDTQIETFSFLTGENLLGSILQKLGLGLD